MLSSDWGFRVRNPRVLLESERKTSPTTATNEGGTRIVAERDVHYHQINVVLGASSPTDVVDRAYIAELEERVQSLNAQVELFSELLCSNSAELMG